MLLNSQKTEGKYEQQRMLDRQKLEFQYSQEEKDRSISIAQASPNIEAMKSTNNFKQSKFKNQQSKLSNPSSDIKDIEMGTLEINNQMHDSSNRLLRQEERKHKKIKRFTSLFSKKRQSTENLGKRSLIMRRCYRITLLFIFELIIIGLFLSFYFNFGFYRGSYEINNSESFSMQLEECYLKIYDYSPTLVQSKGLNFYSTTNVPSSIDGNILLKYSFPNPKVLGESSQMSYSLNNGIRTFQFLNGADSIDCEVVMYVYKPTIIQSLSIDCGRQDCFIINQSKQITFTSLSATGYSIDFNAQYLNTNTLNFFSFFGYVEINDFYFTQASIDISTGDISIQSTKSIFANLQMVSKLYCASTYSNINIVSTVTDVTPNCSPVYPYGSTTQNEQNVVALRCLQGTLTVKSSGSEPNQILNAKNTYGNIFINVLQSPGSSATSNSQVFFDQSVYGQDGNKINLSTQSLNKLNTQLQNTLNPNVYDPIFQLTFGSQYTYSQSFTQWQVTFNPAYTYLKPWWIGTLTFTLLNTQMYLDDLTLAPGFCPYVPGVSQQRIYLIQQLLTTLMTQDQNTQKIITFGWQNSQNLPSIKFSNSNTYNGNRDTDFSSTYSDDWIIFNIDKDGTISVNYTQLNSNQVLLAALIVSFVLAVILGLILLVAIVYVINQNYLNILDHMKHVDTYAQIQKIQKDIQGRDKDLQEISNQEENPLQKKENEEDSDDLQQISIDQQQLQYTVSGILNSFYALVYLSPPLSAYIDQVVLLFYKARVNSAANFFQLLFIEENSQEDNEEQIHNLEKDSISGQDMKVLYEQYCYLNQLLERKLDSQSSINLLKSKGFKISIKQGALISYYSYILYNGNNKVIQDTEGKSSLDLFIKYCCKLTNFDSDCIDSLTFEKHYTEFCTKNHMEQLQLNENDLKREYGIETRFLPQQIVERDPNYRLRKKFNINQNRVKNNFTLILSQNVESVIPLNGNISELNDVIINIYTPKGWLIFDMLTVLAHLCIVFLLGSPLIAIVIFVRMQQTPLLLIPSPKQLLLSDLLYKTSVIPLKLMNDTSFVVAMTLITLIFWALSTWDLIYYYFLMSFPQERYFLNYKNANSVRKFVSRIMWIIVLIVIYIVAIYLCLVITWLILGAIINPQAFLPYATSAATFVTIITQKYNQFKQLSEEGYKKLISYIINFSENQFKDIIKKMDIGEKIEDALPTNQIKSLIRESENNNLIDPKLSQSIQNNIEIMTRDPNAVAHMGQEVFEIAQNPQAYASNLMEKLESKVKEELAQQVSQYLPLMSQSLIQVLQDLFTGDQNRLQQDLTVLFKDFVSQCESNSKIKSNAKLIKSLQILKGPIISFIFDIAFPKKDEKINDIKQKLTANVCSIIQEIINYKTQEKNNSQLNEVVSVKTINLIEKITFFNMKLYQNYKKKQVKEYVYQILEVLSEEDLIQLSSKLKKVSQFSDILQLLMKIVEEKGEISAIPSYDRIRQFIKQILEELMKDKDLKVQKYFDFLVECFLSPIIQINIPQFSQRKNICQQLVNMYDIHQFKDLTRSQISSLITLFSFWLQGSTLNIPTDALKDILSIFSTQYSWINDIIDLNEDSNKNTAKTTQKLKKFQRFFNLFDILINNPCISQKKIEKSSKQLYGASYSFNDFIINCMRVKYKNISNQEDFNVILQSSYFETISKQMKIASYQLIGLLHLILKNTKTQEAYSCIQMIFQQFRINENRIQIFLNIYDLLTSVDERDLNNALNYFQFNQLKVQVSYKKNQPVTLDTESFALLLMYQRNKFRTNLKPNSRIIKLFSFLTKYDPIPDKELKDIKSLKNFSFTFPQQTPLQAEQFKGDIQSLLFLEQEGTIGQKSLSKILNIFTIQGNLNQQLKSLQTKEIIIFSKLLSTRSIPLVFPEIQAQQFKDSIQDLSTLLNVDEYYIQNFLILFTCTNPSKFMKVFQAFGIPLEENEEQFIGAQAQFINQIENKSGVLKEIQENLLRSKIPLSMLEQMLLFNKLPSDSETLYFILNSFYQNISESVKLLINFHYSIPAIEKNSLQQQIKNSIQQNGNKTIAGLETLIQIFKNGAQKEENIVLFLQYLHDSKKTLPLLLGMMFTYLNGDGEQLQIQTDENLGEKELGFFQQKFDISVEQYLSRKLDLKAEFFSALPSVFVQDTYKFASDFIKFYRQEDYQIQREQIQNQSYKSNKFSQVADSQSVNSNQKQINIENLVNRVTVQDKELEQFIRLFSKSQINSSFFSRELSLPIDLIELIQTICFIKNADEEKRQKSYDSLQQNNSCLKIFSQIGIDMNEFITCIKFFYQDFEVSESQILQKGLKLPSKFPFTVLQNLLLLDVYLPPFDDPANNRKKLSQFMKSNQLIKDMEINLKWLQLLYVLYGDFTVLKTFAEGEVQMVTSNKKTKEINILTGLFGVLNKKKTEIQAGDFFKQIYQKLKVQNKLFGQYDKDQIKQRKRGRKDETVLSANQLQKGNTFEYAIYQLCKEMYISPVWVLLMSGDFGMWDELCGTYYGYYKYEKTTKSHNNPIQILILILRMKKCPTIIKEFLIQNELAIISPNIYEDENDEAVKGLKEKSDKLIDEQNNILQNILQLEIESFNELAEQVQFPTKILNLVASYEYNENSNDYLGIKFQESEVDKILIKASQKIYILDGKMQHRQQQNSAMAININNINSGKTIYTEVKNIFQKVDWDFCDYDDKVKPEKIDFPNKKSKEYFGRNELMQIVWISTLTNLQTAYYGYQNNSDRDSDHYKLVSYEIDLFLSIIEYYYFFNLKNNQISKYKIFYLIALACGFNFELKDVLSCNPYNTIYNQLFRKVQKNEEEEEQQYINLKEFFKINVLKNLNEVISLRESNDLENDQNIAEFYFRIYKINVYKRIASPHKGQISQSIFDMYINNFEDLIISQHAKKAQFEFIHEFYISQSEEKELFELLKTEEQEYLKSINVQNFTFLIDFYKENYASMIENDYFISKYEKELKYIVGVLTLNAAFISAKGDIDVDEFVDSLSLVSQYMVSNKRALTQILLLFIDGHDFNLSSITDILQIRSQTLKTFSVIYLSNNSTTIDDDIDYLLSQTSYSETNKWVIKNIMNLYLGDMSQIMSLVSYSYNFSKPAYKSYQELYKFLYAIDSNHLHAVPQQQGKINILNLQYLSSEIEEQEELQNEIIFQICDSIIYSNGSSLDPDVILNTEGGQLDQTSKFKRLYYESANIIRSICRNDWGFINSIDQDELKKQAFCQLFDLSEENCNLIQALSLIKPDITKLKGDPQLNDLLSENNTEKFIKELTNIGICQEKAEQEQCLILTFIANESFPHLVNYLNKVANNIDPNNQAVGIAQKQELSQLLFSIFMIKNCININWNEIYNLIKNNKYDEMHGEKIKMEQLQLFINQTLSGFDVFSAIFEQDINSNRHIEDTTEVESSYSDSTAITEKRLLGTLNFSQFKDFDLEQFFKIQKLLEGNTYSKSFIQMHYIQKAKNIMKMKISQEIQINPANILEANSDKLTYKYITSLITGEALFKYAKDNPIMRKINYVSKVFLNKNQNYFIKLLEKFKKDDSNQTGQYLDYIFSFALKLIYNTLNKQKASNESQTNNFKQQIESVIDMLQALFSKQIPQNKSGNVQQMNNNQLEAQFINFMCSFLLNSNNQDESKSFDQLHKFFFDCVNENFNQVAQFFQQENIKKVYPLLQNLLDRPLLNLEDENLIQDILELLESFDKELIDKKLVTYLINMVVQSDFKNLLEIIEYSNLVSQSEFKIIKQSIHKISSLSIFGNRGALKHFSKPRPVISDQMKEITKRIQDGKITTSDIFFSIDSNGDGNGSISMEEFCNFLRRTGIQMSEHRVNELFATIKKNRRAGNKQSDSNDLNYEEFEEAYQYINKKKTDMSLEKLGISRALLALSLGTLIIILILLLVFIFLGIKAFALGGTFGSIINSIIPAVATTGAASSSSDKKGSLKEDNIKGVMKETYQILHSNQL
ncbi:hypothetical protein ABPG74_021198 [Tetrahymena malaccensis]